MEEKSYRKSRKGKSSFGPKKYGESKLKRTLSNSEHKQGAEERNNRDSEGTTYSEKPKRFTGKSNLKNPSKINPSKIPDKKRPDRETLRKKHYSKKKQLEHALTEGPKDGILRLNRYISNAGECSRREADKRIEEGRVTVNGKTVSEVGTKVKLEDEVYMDGKRLYPENKVYLVLNKPKDFVTTLDDELGRKTVMSLIQNACNERVYPVGRLDRMTTGILIFTNDGELTKRLTHPSYNKKKIYHVFLDRAITKEELARIAKGLELEDGFIQPDVISYADPNDKKQVGIEIHSGKNRIVRRIFEHLGFSVEKLDRVFFAGITKKNLPRGRWRHLTDLEVRMLKG